MSFDSKQFRDLILFPTLHALDLYSTEAENLLFMLAAHESNFGTYLKQVGGGPALGIFQLEKSSYLDLWAYLKHEDSPHHGLVIQILGACNLLREPVAEEMVGNLYLATAMARVFYLRIKEPIPTDLEAMSVYCKKYWNSKLGKATAQNYLDAYNRFEKLS